MDLLVIKFSCFNHTNCHLACASCHAVTIHKHLSMVRKSCQQSADFIAEQFHLNALAYQDNATLPTLWTQFGEGLFLFEHDCASGFINTWMMKELLLI